MAGQPHGREAGIRDGQRDAGAAGAPGGGSGTDAARREPARGVGSQRDLVRESLLRCPVR